MAEGQFLGKVFFITGASAGIGLEMSKQVCANGGKVAMFARRNELMSGLVQTMNKKYGAGTAASFSCDVTLREQVQAAFAAAATELGECDILVANAGVGFPVRVTKFDAEAAVSIFKLNVFGALYAYEAVLPAMMRRKSGHLVGMSSLASFRSYPESHTYCATKSAMNAQLEGMRPELMPHGIHVTTLCPGFVRTELTARNTVPMPMIMTLEDAVGRMLRAIARRKKRAVFPKVMFVFVKLSRLVPDWLMARIMKGKSYKKDA